MYRLYRKNEDKGCIQTKMYRLYRKMTIYGHFSVYSVYYGWIQHCCLAKMFFYTPPHNSGGVLWFHVGRPWVRPSVRPSVVRPSIRFSFPDDNLSKHQWIFTKLGMCIDIVEIWFGIANGQISSIFDGVICPRHADIFVSGLLLQ